MATDAANPQHVIVEQVVRRHAERVAQADPYVGGQDSLPEPGLGSRRFEVRADGAAAVGTAVTIRTASDSADATWGPQITHRLRARVSGSDPAAALHALLDGWERSLPAADPDTGASDRGLVVPWASRDTEPVAAFARSGFIPLRVTGIRPIRADPGHTTPTSRDGREHLAIRPATSDDLEAMVRLVAEMVAFDAQFGWVRVRSSTAAKLRSQLTQALGWDGACWVAEVDADLVGVVVMQPPSHTGWITPLVTLSPIAYLAFMSVAPGHRSRTIGAALADRAATQARDWDAAAVMLHYVLPNPLSAPFWSRQGYRPLLTEWMKLPTTPISDSDRRTVPFAS